MCSIASHLSLFDSIGPVLFQPNRISRAKNKIIKLKPRLLEKPLIKNRLYNIGWMGKPMEGRKIVYVDFVTQVK